jgi:hypothetical protein
MFLGLLFRDAFENQQYLSTQQEYYLLGCDTI